MIEVLKQMVEALEVDAYVYNGEKSWAAIQAGKQAIAELESQKPVAVWELFEDGWDSIADPEWMESLPIGTKLYTHPPQRTWVNLTNEEIEEIKLKAGSNVFSAIMFTNDRLEEKNT